jgi:hypothetical protein
VVAHVGYNSYQTSQVPLVRCMRRRALYQVPTSPLSAVSAILIFLIVRRLGHSGCQWQNLSNLCRRVLEFSRSSAPTDVPSPYKHVKCSEWPSNRITRCMPVTVNCWVEYDRLVYLRNSHFPTVLYLPWLTCIDSFLKVSAYQIFMMNHQVFTVDLLS